MGDQIKRKKIASRIPFVGEVHDAYLRTNTLPPHLVEPTSFLNFIDIARASVVGSPWDAGRKNHFLGMLHYELGQSQQANDANAAAKSYLKSIHLLEKSAPKSKVEALQNQYFLTISRLLFTRLDEGERLSRLQLKSTVRELGGLIVGYSESLPKEDSERAGIYGRLIEIAVAATALSRLHGKRTFIATPTTKRQDAPRPANGMSWRETIAGVQTITSSDLNIATHPRTSLDFDEVVSAQVKSKWDGAPDRYHPTIPVIYADLALDVENSEQLGRYGLMLEKYSGKSTQALRHAWEYIDEVIADSEPLAM